MFPHLTPPLRGSLAGSSYKVARRSLIGADSEPVRILLVEDNSRHAELMRDALGHAGVAFSGAPPYDLTHVLDLPAAFEHLKTAEADVLLLDLSLKEAPGLDALLRIRERWVELPVIALVALGDVTLASQALRAGAQDYLMKGRLNGDLLARSIRHAMEVARLRAALRSLSFIDGLTALYNRRGFVTLADPYVKRAQRVKGNFLVFSVDVAGLGKINSVAGYDEGDQVLRAVAEILRRSFRDSDLLGRLEGGEFTALALDASEDKSTIINSRIAHHVQEFNNLTIRRYRLILHTGFTPFDADAAPPFEELMVQAAEARRRGRAG